VNIGELDGVKIILSPEAYAEVKKQKIIEENKILKEQQQEIERYKNITERIQSIYTSMQFSAPENMYVFIDQLGEILEELKGE